jgi:hypothetical protein
MSPPSRLELGMVLEKYSELLRLMGRQDEAEAMEARLRATRARLLQEPAASRQAKPPSPQ